MTQMRSAVVFVLTTLLTAQSFQAQQAVANSSMKQEIAALPAKAHVAVALADGSTVRGRIGNRNEQDFVLKTDNGGAPQTIAYAQVSAVEKAKASHTKAKWIIIGAVAGAAVVVGVLAVYILHHPVVNLPAKL